MTQDELLELIAQAAREGWTKLNLSDLRLKAIPPEIGCLTTLRELDLSHNRLTAVPPEIGDLTALQQLNLSYNRLTAIPSKLSRLRALRDLDLSHNQLTTLPPKIIHSTGLFLDLSNNPGFPSFSPKVSKISLSTGDFIGPTGNSLGSNCLLTHTRLDAAAPDQVYLGRVFNVAASVRQPDSRLLEVNGFTQVRSGAARLLWPKSKDYVRLHLRISAPECHIVADDSHVILLARNEDSDIFFFHLIPRQTGDITVIVTLYQEVYTLGSARVCTISVPQVAGEIQLSVTSEAVPVYSPSKDHSLPGLPADLCDRLRRTFTQSSYFASDANLQTLFIDGRIVPWCSLISDNTPNLIARIAALINTLHNRTNVDGKNALILFLHVLADSTNPADALYPQLLSLATDLDLALAAKEPV